MKQILLTLTVTFIATVAYGQTSQSFNYEWAVNAKGKGDDRGFKVTSDLEGNLIVIGRFHSQELMFDNIILVNSDQDSSTADAFIVKYNSAGKVLWAKSFGGYGDEFATDCSTDSKGNIVLISGYDCEHLNIGNYNFKNKTAKGEGSDIIIIKYSPDGKVIWARSIGGAKHDGGYATCAIDKKGNIYLTGQFNSDKFFIDSLEIIKSKKRGADVFLAKLSASGKPIWAKSSNGPNTFDSESQSCGVDKQDNIIISGWYGGPFIAFNGDTLKENAENSNGIFVAKYSPTGKLQWANNYGGSVATSRVDGEGNIFLAGIFGDSIISYENILLYNHGNGNLFIAKLNPKGKVLWAKNAGGKSSDAVRNFCIDGNGNAIITGTFRSPLWTLGKTTLTKDTISSTTKNEKRTEDMFIATYSKDGEVLWVKYAGGQGRNAGRSCVTDKEGNIYWTGSFDVTKLILGSLSLTNSGDSDVFIIKLSQNH